MNERSVRAIGPRSRGFDMPEGWLLLAAGLVWLGFAAAGGPLRALVAGVVGRVSVAAGVGVLLYPGDLRVVSFGAIASLLGLATAVLGVFAFGLGTSLGLAVLAVLGWLAAGRVSLAWTPPTNHVPAREDSLRLAAQVAMDEALLASFHLRLDFPAGPRLDAVARDAIALGELLADRGLLEKPLAYHRPPPPLETALSERAHTGSIDYEHVAFPSEWEPLAEAPGRDRWLDIEHNRTAHAYVVRRDPKAPWLVAINGYRMGFAAIDLRLFDPRIYCDRLGLNLVVPVLPLHGPRRIGRFSGDGYLDGDPVVFAHAEAQAIWDLRRIVSWVRAQGAERVGVLGLSLGGYNPALLACVEDELACAIAGIPVSDFSRIMWTHGPAWLTRSLEQHGLTREQLGTWLRPVSPLALEPRVERAMLAVFGGTGDRIVPPEHQRDLVDHWQPARHCWYQGGHVTFRLDPAVDAMVRATLRERLLGAEPVAAPAASSAARSA